jgi:hypothetical protein
MKNNYGILFSYLFAVFVSCKKENKPVNQLSPLGTWQQIKLNVFVIVPSGAISDDTTYSAPKFTNMDYVQFNPNNTCIISTDHTNFPIGKGYPNLPATPVTRDTLTFAAIGGSVYVLNIPPSLNPGGFVTTDTLTLLNSNNLLIHQVSYQGNPDGSSVFDSFYAK